MKRCAKVLIIIAMAVFVILLFSSCGRTVYVPVETLKTEYRDKYLRDSVYLYDSVFVAKWRSNDTLFLTQEKYKYLYRDKLVRDTVCITDSIAVPYPVVQTKEVNRLHTWQVILMILGGALIGYMAFRLFGRFK